MKLSYSFLFLALGSILTLASPLEKRQTVDLVAAFQNVPDPNVTSTTLPAVIPDYLKQKFTFNVSAPNNVKRCYSSYGGYQDGKYYSTYYDQTVYIPGSDTYQNTASSAPTPPGTNVIFTAKNAASQFSNSAYAKLDSYDPQTCYNSCKNDIAGCLAFNIYYFAFYPEDSSCSSYNRVKILCDYLTYVPDDQPGTGNYDTGIEYLRILGSNGYKLSTVPQLNGFQFGHDLGTCVVNAPLDADNNNINTYMGLKTFTDTDYNQCAKACTDTTAYNSRHPKADGTYNSCNYFTAALVYTGDTLEGLACALYTKDWSSIESTKKNCGNRGKTYKAAASYLINGYSTASRTELKQVVVP